NQLPSTDLPLADSTVSRRKNLCVTQVHPRNFECGFFSMEVGYELNILRLQHGFTSALGLRRRLIATEQSTSLHQISIAAGILRRYSLFIGHCFFHCLLGGGISLEQRFLTVTL